MKWACVSICVALIISIMVISCCMICTGRYQCEAIVWGLYGLLVLNSGISGYFIIIRLRRKVQEKQLEELQKNNKHLQNVFESEILKKIYALEIALDKLNKDITNIKNSIF